MLKPEELVAEPGRHRTGLVTKSDELIHTDDGSDVLEDLAIDAALTEIAQRREGSARRRADKREPPVRGMTQLNLASVQKEYSALAVGPEHEGQWRLGGQPDLAGRFSAVDSDSLTSCFGDCLNNGLQFWRYYTGNATDSGLYEYATANTMYDSLVNKSA